MGAFSLRRVAEYLRYNYTVQSRNYVWNLLAMFAVPVFFGLLNKTESVVTASGMSLFVYIVAAWVLPIREMWTLRDRNTKVMAMTLPVSSEERWVSMLFNLAVVFPLVAILTSVLAIVVVASFDRHDLQLGEFIVGHLEGFYFDWAGYVLVQLFASVSLFMAVISRRSIILTYVVAVVGVMVILFGLVDLAVDREWYINIEANIETVELVGKLFFCLLPVVFYVLSYVALRKRQVKW